MEQIPCRLGQREDVDQDLAREGVLSRKVDHAVEVAVDDVVDGARASSFRAGYPDVFTGRDGPNRLATLRQPLLERSRHPDRSNLAGRTHGISDAFVEHHRPHGRDRHSLAVDRIKAGYCRPMKRGVETDLFARVQTDRLCGWH